MSDRELLELAAKAAGLRTNGRYDFQLGIEVSTPHNAPYCWNPLSDDGAALRLAIAMRLTLHLELPRIGIGPRMDFPEVWVEEDQDEGEEVRRAIVTAAAKIGKEMA